MSKTSHDGYEPAEHYDRVTDGWRLLLGEELHYGVFSRGDESLAAATRELTDLMIRAAQLVPDLDVVDVGCGTGAPACRLVVEQDVRVVGITTSTVGVAAAKRRAQSLGLSRASFELRDGTDSGFPDESFDRAWVLESSHLMRDRDALLSECARVLRPGGRLVLCDLIRHREIPFLEVRDRREEFAVLRAAFGDARMEPLSYYTSQAESLGLVVDFAEDLTRATLPTFDRWRTNAANHRVEAQAALGAEGLAAFEQSTEILESLWLDGTFGYGLFSAFKPDA